MHTHTHACVYACMHVHTCIHTCTHTHTYLRAVELKKRSVKRERFSSRIKTKNKKTTTDGRSMRSRELVPGSFRLVRERVLTTEVCAEWWYSEHWSVCGRMELSRWGEKVKTIWEVSWCFEPSRPLRILYVEWSLRGRCGPDQRDFNTCTQFSGLTVSQWRQWSRGVAWADLGTLRVKVWQHPCGPLEVFKEHIKGCS